MRAVKSIFIMFPVCFTFVECCTTILVSLSASALNASMCAHSADCSDCDSRVALVPNRRHNGTALHAVRGIHHRYPREYSDRAFIYSPPENMSFDTPLGFIPEVNETFGMWESVYGLMNEHGLTIGESSTYARINAPGVDLEDPSTQKKGPAMFSIAMLIQLALERCTTAVCAVKTMGRVSEEYGFYAETFNAGEALSIADTQGDGWIFHILPDPTGRSSVWCARKVPDGHVAAVANQFTISTVNSSDSDNYMHSERMFEIAVEEGLWNASSSEFKFNQVFGSPGSLPMYSSVRLWYIYSRVAPSLNLSVTVNPFDLPFSVPVDRKVTLEDVMSIFRSHYEGTVFDMTRGILAGPFGNPQRVDAGEGVKNVGGQITRAISIQRTAYTMIGVADSKSPLVYYATDAPATSVFVPFLASTIRNSRKISPSHLYSRRYQTGKKTKFDRFSAWWAFDFVANWMNINYHNMSSTFVQPAIEEWQPRLIQAAKSLDEKTIIRETDRLVQAWWSLADTLVVTYNDGYFTSPDGTASYTGYPEPFLRSIGFNDEFVFPVDVCPEKSCLASNNQDVNTIVNQLHFLKDVVIPAEYNKTVIAHISANNSQAIPGTDSFRVVCFTACVFIFGALVGFLSSRKCNTRVRISNEELRTALVH